MSLKKSLEAVVRGMPDEGSVSLPVAWVRALLEAEDEEGRAGRLLTLEEAAERVQRAPGTVRTWCNSGRLEGAFKLQGRSWRIPEGALQRFLERQAQGEEPTVRTGREADLASWRKVRKEGKRDAA